MNKCHLVAVLTLSSIWLKPNEAVVTAQWAVGDGLKRWIKEVTKLLK